MSKLSVIVPVYNEAKHLRVFVETLMQAPCPIEREWIFIDDCSKDGSFQILNEMSAKYSFRLIQQTMNQGKGSAIICGIQEASGDFIMIQDADFEYDPNDVPALLEPLLKGEADVVYGSRFKKSVYQVHRTYHYFVNYFLTILSNLFSGLYLTDMETCYKVFRSDLMKSMDLKSKRFGIEVELTAYIAKIRARVFEVPIHYYPRTKLQGKKIGWKDGLSAMIHLLRFNFFTTREQAYHQVPQRYLPEFEIANKN